MIEILMWALAGGLLVGSIGLAIYFFIGATEYEM